MNKIDNINWRVYSLVTVLLLLPILFSSNMTVHAVNQTVDTSVQPVINAPSSTGIIISNDAQLQAASTGGDGSQGDPYEIKDLEIDTTDIYALSISGTTSYFEILNCTLTGNYGIYLGNVPDSTAIIRNNTIKNCSDYGIRLYLSDYTLVEDNILINNHVGIYNYRSTNVNLTGNDMFGCGIDLNFNSVVDMETLTIASCTVNSKPVLYSVSENGQTITSEYGQIIIVNGTSIDVMDQTLTNTGLGLDVWYSEDIEITNCIFGGGNTGIQLLVVDIVVVTGCDFSSLYYGINPYGVNNILIFENNFEDNENGIYAEEATEMNIYMNNFNNNSAEGVSLDYCGDCMIYKNNFTDNGFVYGQQAYDSYPITGHENLWYNNVTNEGNWWSDYSGTGNYTIPGAPDDVFDLYPLNEPYYLIPEFSSNFWLILTTIMFSIIIITALRKRK